MCGCQSIPGTILEDENRRRWVLGRSSAEILDMGIEDRVFDPSSYASGGSVEVLFSASFLDVVDRIVAEKGFDPSREGGARETALYAVSVHYMEHFLARDEGRMAWIVQLVKDVLLKLPPRENGEDNGTETYTG